MEFQEEMLYVASTKTQSLKTPDTTELTSITEWLSVDLTPLFCIWTEPFSFPLVALLRSTFLLCMYTLLQAWRFCVVFPVWAFWPLTPDINRGWFISDASWSHQHQTVVPFRLFAAPAPRTCNWSDTLRYWLWFDQAKPTFKMNWAVSGMIRSACDAHSRPKSEMLVSAQLHITSQFIQYQTKLSFQFFFNVFVVRMLSTCHIWLVSSL